MKEEEKKEIRRNIRKVIRSMDKLNRKIKKAIDCETEYVRSIIKSLNDAKEIKSFGMTVCWNEKADRKVTKVYKLVSKIKRQQTDLLMYYGKFLFKNENKDKLKEEEKEVNVISDSDSEKIENKEEDK